MGEKGPGEEPRLPFDEGEKETGEEKKPTFRETESGITFRNLKTPECQYCSGSGDCMYCKRGRLETADNRKKVS